MKQFPHAPWWTYGEKANDEAGFNPSAILAGFILSFADSASKLYDTVLSMTETMFGKIRNSGHVEVHELNCYCRLLEDLRPAGLTGRQV